MSYQEDPLHKYHRWKLAVERDDQNPEQTVNEILAEVKLIKADLLEAEPKQSFVNTYLPIYTRYLLEKRYHHYPGLAYALLLELFNELTAVSLENLGKGLFGYFECLMKFLDYDMNFYDRHYSPVPYHTEKDLKSEFEKKWEKREEFYFVNHSKSLSILFNIYLNSFGNNKGFEVLSDYIKTASIDHVTQVLHKMVTLDDVMPTSAWKKAAISIYKESISAISLLSEDLKNLQKQDLKIFFINLEKILDKLYSNKKMGKILENLELEIAVKMLGSGVLEKRIYGITEIVNKIVQAKNLDEDNERRSKGFYVYKNEYRDSVKWLTSEKLLTWLDSQDLVGVIFGPTSHHEIIKRSADLIKFLYSNSRFSQEQLRRVWEVAFSKHEAEREALLSLIQELVTVLDAEDLQFLYNQVIALPYAQIDSQILQLVKSYARLGNYFRPSLKKSRSCSNMKDAEKKNISAPTTELSVQIPPRLPFQDSKPVPSFLTNAPDDENTPELTPSYQTSEDSKELVSPPTHPAFQNGIPIFIPSVPMPFSSNSDSVPNLIPILPNPPILPTIPQVQLKSTPPPLPVAVGNTNYPITDTIKPPPLPITVPEIPVHLTTSSSKPPPLPMQSPAIKIPTLPPVPPNLPIVPEFRFESSQVLSFIWELWQEPALTQGISNDMAVQAMSILKDSLLNYFRGERQKFLEKCIKNIKNSSIVLWSCDMIKSILESYPSVRAQFDRMDSKSSIIRTLEEEFHLTQELYKSLILFKKQAVEQALQISGDESTSSSDDEMLCEVKRRTYEELFKGIFVSKEVKVSYIEEVKIRLEFLKYVYSNSNETLSSWHVKLLWESFVMNATSDVESELLFNWLMGCTNSWPNRMMASDELQLYIFTELLLKIHTASFTQSAFLCFERFFININKHYGLISACCSDDSLEILNIQLIASEALWEIMLHSRSESVFLLSSSLLKRIYKGLRSCTQSIQEDFIRTCMSHIESVSPVLVLDEKSVNKVSRCLELLSDFIDDFEICEPQSSFWIKIKYFPKFSSEAKEFSLTVNSESQWQAVKEKILKKLDLWKGVFYVRGKALTRDADLKTVESLGVEENEMIVVKEEEDEWDVATQSFETESSVLSLKSIFEHLSEEVLRLALEKCDNQVEDAVVYLTDGTNVEILQQSQKISKKPKKNFKLSNILSNTQHYFSQLFDLFSFSNHKINTKLWNLLSKLSINDRIFEEIKILNNTHDWNNLFDSRCTFKLLYSLQIADEILLQDTETVWKQRFSELGGLRHLYNVLINYQHLALDSTGSFDLKVLEYLLKILSCYLNPPSILESFDYSALVSCIIQIIQDSVNCSQTPESLISQALQFLSLILRFQPDQLLPIYQSHIFDNLLSNVLLNSSQKSIREAICSTIESIKAFDDIPEGLEQPSEYFWKIFLNNLPVDNNQNCEEFFYLALRFMDFSPTIDSNLIDTCIEFVISRKTIEDRHKGNQDKVLTGYLQIIKKLFQIFPEKKSPNFLAQIYSFLFDLDFDYQHDMPPKFKHPSTRQAGFDIINTLCINNSENSEILLEKLYFHHSTQKTVAAEEANSPNYAARVDTEIKPRASSGYVGLRNFGSTCYMNSLMQQIFMMTEIRTGILNTSLKPDQDLSENVLYQLQVLLANLQESEKEYFDAFGFCQAFKGYDGEAINVRVQQDADEFLNLLFDKLEELMKGTEKSNLLRDHIGGSFIHEIVSTETEFPYYSSRDEHFFRISLDVKNKKNLQEALDLFIKDDMLEGDNKYFCEKYDAKITAKTRCLINTMANTVIIHLKRFEFDYTTMQRCKINDYCEFPMSINFKTWAKEGSRDDGYYEYELAGILLHSGVADSGHYTSIIKDRVSMKWFRFDDRYVEVYDLENLKNDCFGGETTFSWGPNYQTYSQTKNAYMLIYERKFPIPINQPLFTSSPNSCLSQISQKIKAENMNFLKDLLYFDKGYFDFLSTFVTNYDFHPSLDYSESMSDTKDTKELLLITKYIEEDESRAEVNRETLQSSEEIKNLLSTIDHDQDSEDSSFKIIKLGTLFAYETLTRSKNFDNFKYWIRILQDFYQKHIKAAIWFLNYLLQNREIISEVLVECRDSEIRSEFSRFISKILKFCSETEHSVLLSKVRVVNLSVLPYYEFSGYNHYSLFSVRPRAVSARFIELYLKEFLHEFKKNSRKIEDFLLIISEFAECGTAHKFLLIECNCIAELVNTLNDHDVYSASDETEQIFKLLASLVLFCRTQGIRVTENYPQNFKYPGIDLESITENQMTDFSIKRALVQHVQIADVEDIICHLCWENVKVSCEFLEDFAGNLLSNKFESAKVTVNLKIIQKILLLKDQSRKNRVREFLLNTSVRHIYSIPSRQTFFEQIQKAKDSYCGFVMNIIIWWSDLMEHDYILEVTKSLQNQFKWIPEESYYRVMHYNFPDYFSRGLNFEAEFENALKKFRTELDSDSEEGSEVEVNRYREGEYKEDGEETSTESENY